VPLEICLEAAQGLLVLSEGLTDATLQDQVPDIAAAMCQNNATASIGDAGGGGGGDTGGDGECENNIGIYGTCSPGGSTDSENGLGGTDCTVGSQGDNGQGQGQGQGQGHGQGHP
jgi:hypothetical protein